MKAVLRGVALVAVLGLAGGCTHADRQAACPGMAVLADAATQHVFRPGSPAADPSNVLYTVQIVRVKGTCDISKKSRVAGTDLDIRFRATRAPNGQAAQYVVNYFIAVTQGDNIVRKVPHQIQFAFAPGQAAVDFDESVSPADIKMTEGKHPWDYQVLVGLPLTKGDLQYNRNIGSYGQ
ncbi:MAG TPA: hypothetical protein VMH86_17320 [Rhizomicrobium sp.]|nr:hypothetical protein [Rhizomicrobium sp.]